MSIPAAFPDMISPAERKRHAPGKSVHSSLDIQTRTGRRAALAGSSQPSDAGRSAPLLRCAGSAFFGSSIKVYTPAHNSSPKVHQNPNNYLAHATRVGHAAPPAAGRCRNRGGIARPASFRESHSSALRRRNTCSVEESQPSITRPPRRQARCRKALLSLVCTAGTADYPASRSLSVITLHSAKRSGGFETIAVAGHWPDGRRAACCGLRGEGPRSTNRAVGQPCARLRRRT